MLCQMPCVLICALLVDSAHGHILAQTGGLCFSKKPNMFSLKFRDLAEEQSDLV